MVEWIVSSSVLIAVVILLRFVLKGKINLRLQYALWALVLARLLVPVSFGDTALSVGNLTQKAATSEPAQIVSALSEIELPKMSYQAAYNEVAKEYADRGIKIEDMPLEEYAETVDYEIMNKMNGDLSIAEVVKIVWFCGIALVGVWFVISNLRLLHSLKKNRTLLSSDHALPVYLSNAIDTPCLFGLFHPAIYLTSEAIESEHTQRHAVEHELTHFHHKDNIWAILRSVCLAVHWYNPLVWYAAVLSRNDAELACDESTILRLGEEERASYGRTLIHLTCEKRPALLNTATTMTGSGKSIKERIALIVKKPKMALYTVIAVVVIAAVAVGCTFTGAKDQPASFEEWASSLTGEAIEWAETAKGYGVEEISYTVPESEFDDLSALLATITDENCSRKKPEAANEAGYRLALYRDDKLWLFKCLADGTIGLMFNDAETGAYYGSEGKLLIIEHPELWNYIVDTVDEKGIADTTMPIGISDIDVNTVPGPVIDYAENYVRQQIDHYNELGSNPPEGLGKYTITSAMITKLEQVNTGTAGLNDGVALYLLEYRLLPDHPENILMAGGMSVESGWLTEQGSTGRPYLLLHYSDSGSETVWTPICITNTDAIEVDYGTPKMLEKYGNAYTAAAMELWEEYKLMASGRLDIQEIINRIFVGALSYDESWKSAGNYTLTISGLQSSTTINFCVPGSFHALTSTPGYEIEEMYNWSESGAWDDADSSSDYILTAANDQYSMSIYSNERKLKLKSADGNITYFIGTPREENPNAARQDYEDLFLYFRAYAMGALEANELLYCSVDGSETDYGVIARKLSEQYAEIIPSRPKWYHQRALDAKVATVEVFDAYYGEDNPNFCFRIELYLKIPEDQTLYWQAGAGLSDPLETGEYAGYYGYGAEVCVRKSDDGRWRMDGFASGGSWVYLPVAPEEASTEQLMELFFLTSGHSRDWRILPALMEHPLEEIQEQLETLDNDQLQAFISGLKTFTEENPDSYTWSPDDFQMP